jgi:hypothetical protein
MKISKKRLLNALKNLVLFSAVLHMFILAVYAIATNDIGVLNYFNILDLEFFWPPIIEGRISLLASLAAAVLITVFFYYRSRD